MFFDYHIIDDMDVSIYKKDLNGRYLGCNRYMEKMAGLPRDKIIGLTDHELPWSSQASRITEIDQAVIKNKKIYFLEEKAQLSNGAIKIFLSSKKPLLDRNNEVIGVIGVSIDITHYKNLETEFERTDRILGEYLLIKNRFLKNISHETRIPLGSIMSISESLKDNWDKFDDATKKDNFLLINKEINRLSKFILDTFDTSKYLNQGIELNLHKENFAKFVEDLVLNYKKIYETSRIKISIDHSEEIIFYFDKILISRVIDNLILNAIRYSPKEKEISINVYKTYLKNTNIPAIQFSISDQGVGIPPQEIESIFNPFVESSRTESKACGVGLGLSICKEIIEAHSGYIWAENNHIKSGSTFCFSIPTNLFPFSQEKKIKESDHEDSSVIKRNLSIIPQIATKKPFALICIRPFSGYYSSEKILEILQWVDTQYENFGIFLPNQISKYTYQALGYSESSISTKIRKQDNYIINKIESALENFYERSKREKNINLYLINNLMKTKHYNELYEFYSNLFIKDKDFRQQCIQMTEKLLQTKTNKLSNKIEESVKNIAAQYLLLELPVIMHATTILDVEFCDFVYHTIPKFIEHLYNTKDFIPKTQKFLVLSD